MSTLVVRPAEAVAQREAEEEQQRVRAAEGAGVPIGVGDDPASGVTEGLVDNGGPDIPARPPAAVFRGSVTLDPHRPVKAFGELSKEILDHLASPVGAGVEVRVEIVARKPDGFPDHTVRTVTENAHTLKFDEVTGFSEE
jgi:hypothetical protein